MKQNIQKSLVIFMQNVQTCPHRTKACAQALLHCYVAGTVTTVIMLIFMAQRISSVLRVMLFSNHGTAEHILIF